MLISPAGALGPEHFRSFLKFTRDEKKNDRNASKIEKSCECQTLLGPSVLLWLSINLIFFF